MTKSTNPHAPAKDYENCQPSKGAAFRDSITCTAARAKLPSDGSRAIFDAKISVRPKKGAGSNKAFYSNPWPAFAAGGAISGTEIHLGHDLWRLIRFQGCWFLAKHVGGNNDFEYWHISDPPALSAALPDTKSTTNPPVVLAAQPILTPPTQIPSMTVANATTTVLVPSQQPVVPDSWEELDDKSL